mmetsp:Transcript_38252/g.46685  ORF Transcript_38252/g.46685 Transcript_38252/m.46685 type:complete len:314 (+) Transcript_38252:262-1203(+)
MPRPPIWASIRQTLGRAFRETGQALDRTGLRGLEHARQPRTYDAPPVEVYLFNDHLSRHRNKMALLQRGEPQIDPDVEFIAPCSSLIGNVRIGSGSSVWYGAVLRADRCLSGMGNREEVIEEWRSMTVEERRNQGRDYNFSSSGGAITIGSRTNVQDGVIISSNEDHCTIGDGVTIGHGAVIQSARVEDNCLIGMGSVINSGVTVESFSFVAAGAVVGRGVTVKSGELWAGNPARKLRDLTEGEKEKLVYQANEYVSVAGTQKHVMELGGSSCDKVIEKLKFDDDTKNDIEDVVSSKDEKEKERELVQTKGIA